MAGWRHAKLRGAERVKRKWVALLMLALAAPSPAFAAIPIATAIIFELHASEHRHSVSVVGDDSHRHLVLTHDEKSDPGEHGEALSHADHVVELAWDGVASAASRRDAPDPPAAIGPELAFSAAPAPTSSPRRYAEIPAPPFDPVRTVVLRL